MDAGFSTIFIKLFNLDAKTGCRQTWFINKKDVFFINWKVSLMSHCCPRPVLYSNYQKTTFLLVKSHPVPLKLWTFPSTFFTHFDEFWWNNSYPIYILCILFIKVIKFDFKKFRCHRSCPRTMANLGKICPKILEVCFWHGFDIFTYQLP